MRIAQVAPLVEAVPPRLYGGTERVISWLTEDLVASGHDVTLFASGDSHSAARHFVTVAEAARGGSVNARGALATVFAHVRSQIDAFDIVHFHTEFAHFGAFRGLERKCLTTMHLRLDTPEAAAAVAAHPGMALVSISDRQRSPLPGARFVATIPHGFPAISSAPAPGRAGIFSFSVVFLRTSGRIAPSRSRGAPE